jgi:hypothetical protein
LLEGATAPRSCQLRLNGQYALTGVYLRPREDRRGCGPGETLRELRVMGDSKSTTRTDWSEWDRNSPTLAGDQRASTRQRGPLCLSPFDPRDNRRHSPTRRPTRPCGRLFWCAIRTDGLLPCEKRDRGANPPRFSPTVGVEEISCQGKSDSRYLLDLYVFPQPVGTDVRRVDGALGICHNA